MPKDKIPTDHQAHPLELATIAALKLEGLQPADSQSVAALFHLRMGDREHLCDLWRVNAVPLQVKESG